MGDYGYDDDDDYGQGDGPAALRAADKAKAKEIKRLEALVEKQAADLAAMQASVRKASVADVLTAKGVNPKVAALIPADVDPSEDGISAWLTEFGDVFGVKDSSESAGKDQVAAATLPEEEDPQMAALAAAWARASAASDGQPPTSFDALAAGGLSKIAESTQSFDDAVKALQGLPGFDVGDYRS